MRLPCSACVPEVVRRLKLLSGETRGGEGGFVKSGGYVQFFLPEQRGAGVTCHMCDHKMTDRYSSSDNMFRSFFCRRMKDSSKALFVNK